MMEFKFNFDSTDAGLKEEQHCETEKPLEITTRDAVEIKPTPKFDFIKKLEKEACEIKIGSCEIKHISSSTAIKYLKELEIQCESILTAEHSHSDLLPGIYEGGLKIWECSLDLSLFLWENKCITAGSSVLELGCGAALPGLIAYISGANVTFQDYNEEVLNSVTVANVFLNTKEADRTTISDRCHFIAGDWGKIDSKYYGEKSSNNTLYDIILTSETIYAKENSKKLLELIKHSLKPTGVVYLAAKSYYFGVGGSVADFELLVKGDGVLDIEEVSSSKEGVGRVILQLKFEKEKDFSY